MKLAQHRLRGAWELWWTGDQKAHDSSKAAGLWSSSWLKWHGNFGGARFSDFSRETGNIDFNQMLTIFKCCKLFQVNKILCSSPVYIISSFSSIGDAISEPMGNIEISGILGKTRIGYSSMEGDGDILFSRIHLRWSTMCVSLENALRVKRNLQSHSQAIKNYIARP